MSLSLDRSSQSVLYGGAAVAAVAAAGYYVWTTYVRRPSCPVTPHVIPRHIPLIGDVARALHAADLDDNVRDFEKLQASSICFRLPGQGWVVATVCPSNAQWILRTNFENYPKGQEFHDILEDFLGDGIFSTDGEIWRLHRKRAAPMFSLTMLRDFMFGVFKEHTETLMGILGEAAEEERVVDIYSLLSRFTLECIGEIGFGSEMGCLESEASEFLSAFDRANELTELRGWNPLWRVTRWLPFVFGPERQLRKDIQALDRLSLSIVRKRREEMMRGEEKAALQHEKESEKSSETRLLSLTAEAEQAPTSLETSSSAAVSTRAHSPFFSRRLATGSDSSQGCEQMSSEGSASSVTRSEAEGEDGGVRSEGEEAEGMRGQHSSGAGGGREILRDLRESKKNSRSDGALSFPDFSEMPPVQPPHPLSLLSSGSQAATVSPPRRDFLSLFMAADPHMSDKQLRDMVLNFLIAGKDTMSQALSWALYELMQHPEDVQRAREEVRSAMREAGGELDFQATRSKLPFVTAVIHETLRLHPSVPRILKRALGDDTLPDGTFVPAGSIAVVCAHTMGRLASVWGEDAKKFRPSRWLEFEKLPPSHKFVAFQAGPRECLGRHMAMLEMTVALASLLDHFDFLPAEEEGRLGSVQVRSGLTLAMKNGMRVRVVKAEK
uniref:Cytochrome P450 n=1 Tax=Chromera velia CCMP2878 TaxID=1169474 RepID=A0A0G4HDI5_9ALVE|eukprot:Cvel_6456.t1-p1 / transcript=Cvel_6456.t1 / gene=Cvel_6456 / organism=Chromera_velia_CCMP2878 / gene_product=Cytochrome P450 86A2, putative / transcript_product=Cytochrome P450 86A2, putative / location=Cvel_scaffold316:33159-36332(-) / protein_length=665 / sequence_SO=supercontig / SO=protein_coding / is_pseudo=false